MSEHDAMELCYLGKIRGILRDEKNSMIMLVREVEAPASKNDYTIEYHHRISDQSARG